MSLPGVELLAWIASAGAASGVLLVVGRRVVRALRRVSLFLGDWEGTPARPGVAERPGVMTRLAGIEQRLDGVEAEVRKSTPPPVTINMPQSLNQHHPQEET